MFDLYWEYVIEDKQLPKEWTDLNYEADESSMIAMIAKMHLEAKDRERVRESFLQVLDWFTQVDAVEQ